MTDSTASVTRCVISSPDTQAAIWFLGALSQVRFSGEQADGAFSLVENLNRRGNGSPVHVHDQEHETLFVLDGELQVFVGEEEHTAGPGTVAVLPKRLRHAYVVTSAAARFLTLHIPAGFERFAAEVGEPARTSPCHHNRQAPPTPPQWPRQRPGTAWHHHLGPAASVLTDPPRSDHEHDQHDVTTNDFDDGSFDLIVVTASPRLQSWL
jgi:mannose-6-phosphate isomerase-like protein (cupin superfamily)